MDREVTGVDASLINTSQEAGGALGLAVVSTVAYSGVAAVDPFQAHVTANRHAFLTITALATAALLVALLALPRTEPA